MSCVMCVFCNKLFIMLYKTIANGTASVSESVKLGHLMPINIFLLFVC